MKKQEVMIRLEKEDSVSPIALLVQLASRFKSDVFVDIADKHINAKSIMGMMSISLPEGEKITVTAEGEDEEEAIAKMVEFIGNR